MELVKIPALLEHFAQHKSQQNQLSFNDFLFMHYVGDDSNSQDNNSDSELPFKGTSQASGLNVDLYLATQIVFKCEIVHEETFDKAVPSFNESYAGSFNCQLFRPPVFG